MPALASAALARLHRSRRRGGGGIALGARGVAWQRETVVALNTFRWFSYRSRSLTRSICVGLNIEEGPASKQRPIIEAQERESFIDFFSHVFIHFFTRCLW